MLELYPATIREFRKLLVAKDPDLIFLSKTSYGLVNLSSFVPIVNWKVVLWWIRKGVRGLALLWKTGVDVVI